MQIKITNYRGIEHAEIDIEDLTLVAGKNGSGKTSLCESLAGLISGDINVFGLTKANIEKVFHNGSDIATISVESADGGLVCNLPDTRIATVGKIPMNASKTAVGLEPIMGMEIKRRKQFLSEVLECEPSREQLLEKVSDIISGEKFEKLWQSIKAFGWDAALKSVQDKGREFKGAWQQVTSEKYGSSKSDGWLPKGWTNDILQFTEESLEKHVEECSKWVESAIRTDAISDTEIERFRGLVGNVGIIEKKYEETNRIVSECDKKLKELESELRNIRTDVMPQQPCPHCGKQVAINGGMLCKPEKGEKERIATADQARKRVQKEIENCQARQKAHREEAYNLSAQTREAHGAEEKLKTYEGQKQTDSKNLDNAKEDLKIAEEMLRLFKMKTESDKLHGRIKKNDLLQKILDPKGLRSEVLAESLGVINSVLQEMVQMAGWKNIPTLRIDENLDVLGNAFPYQFLSESERLFIDYVLQVVIANKQQASLVILDRVSNLTDKEARNGIMRIVSQTEIPALVTMAMQSEDDIPVEKFRNGKKAYWLEDGKAREL